MFESPSRISKPEQRSQATGWEYLHELEAMAEWLGSGPDASPALASAVAGMDTFRGPDTVRRWIHNLATAHCDIERHSEEVVAYLDRLVERRRNHGHQPPAMALELEVSARLEVLESLCAIPDNYRCALLLKEGSGLTVERTARLMEVSTASLRSILYRARRAMDT